MDNKNEAKRGFTLVELLVVIAIIAILMVVVVLVLNPGELLKQSRDSNRLSDISTLKSALTLYLADVATTTPLAPATKTCYSYMQGGVGTTTCSWFSTTGWNVSSSKNIDGTGWVPVNFQAISAGVPITRIPIDPISNNTSTFYSYTASGTQLFKLAAKMESIKFQYQGSGDVCSTDGGISSTTYETGPGVSTL